MKCRIKKIFNLVLIAILSLYTTAYAFDANPTTQIVEYSDGEIEFDVLECQDSTEGLIVKCAITNNTSETYTFNKSNSYILDANKQDYPITKYEKEHCLVKIRSGARNIVNITFENAKKDLSPYQLNTYIGERLHGFNLYDSNKVTFSNIY